MFMGFTLHFYIIFGTNLLTRGPTRIAVFFAYFSVSQKKNIKRSPNGVYVKQSTRRARGRGRTHLPQARPPPSWAPRCSTDVLLPPIYTYVPQTIRGIHENLIPPPQPSVPVRSHLGAFSGALPEGALITEGFYINTIASPMKRE